MRPTLILQPIHSSSADILRSFATGKPLTSDEMRFLEWHEHQLSSQAFDPVLKYYVEAEKKRRKNIKNTFLLPHEVLNLQDIDLLKKRLKLFLQDKNKRVAVRFTEKQFLQFKEFAMQELIFYHGNQLLTGAPFTPGGHTPVLFFQWGNLFGVVLYAMLTNKTALNAYTVAYFEGMQERMLEQCVADYQHQLKNEVELQHDIFLEHQLDPHAFNHFLIKTPTLTPDGK